MSKLPARAEEGWWPCLFRLTAVNESEVVGAAVVVIAVAVGKEVFVDAIAQLRWQL